MRIRAWVVPLLSSAFIAACTQVVPSTPGTSERSYPVIIDSYTEQQINNILSNVAKKGQQQTKGELLQEISSEFLGTPYKANSLVGGPTVPEALVANFKGVDCFTLLDYVEALSRSHDQETFIDNLVQIRYIHGDVSYLKRKHFFTDWANREPLNAYDVTQALSPAAQAVHKQLNRKKECDCEQYIPGLGFIERTVYYIPTAALDEKVLGQIETGDYIGIYSPLLGLDVTHVGLAIRKDRQVLLRNASSLSANMKVVDTPLVDYMRGKPGIIVLRPMQAQQLAEMKS